DTATIDRFGTSYGVVVAVAPLGMPLTKLDTFDRDVRISTGVAEELKTGCEAVAQGGAGRIGRSKLQIAARRVFVAAIESDTGVRPPTGLGSVRAAQSLALRVHATVNSSPGGRVGGYVSV